MREKDKTTMLLSASWIIQSDNPDFDMQQSKEFFLEDAPKILPNYTNSNGQFKSYLFNFCLNNHNSENDFPSAEKVKEFLSSKNITQIDHQNFIMFCLKQDGGKSTASDNNNDSREGGQLQFSIIQTIQKLCSSMGIGAGHYILIDQDAMELKYKAYKNGVVSFNIEPLAIKIMDGKNFTQKKLATLNFDINIDVNNKTVSYRNAQLAFEDTCLYKDSSSNKEKNAITAVKKWYKKYFNHNKNNEHNYIIQTPAMASIKQDIAELEKSSKDETIHNICARARDAITILPTRYTLKDATPAAKLQQTIANAKQTLTKHKKLQQAVGRIMLGCFETGLLSNSPMELPYVSNKLVLKQTRSIKEKEIIKNYIKADTSGEYSLTLLKDFRSIRKLNLTADDVKDMLLAIDKNIQEAVKNGNRSAVIALVKTQARLQSKKRRLFGKNYHKLLLSGNDAAKRTRQLFNQASPLLQIQLINDKKTKKHLSFDELVDFAKTDLTGKYTLDFLKKYNATKDKSLNSEKIQLLAHKIINKYKTIKAKADKIEKEIDTTPNKQAAAKKLHKLTESLTCHKQILARITNKRRRIFDGTNYNKRLKPEQLKYIRGEIWGIENRLSQDLSQPDEKDVSTTANLRLLFGSPQPHLAQQPPDEQDDAAANPKPPQSEEKHIPPASQPIIPPTITLPARPVVSPIHS